ncbi:MAG TPA: hypothetical protein VH165_08955 [Kofleriaceae bacterium]|jgi:hypothetical protein|nr:hypothetical protein [Kofleriaceae bacterium]
MRLYRGLKNSYRSELVDPSRLSGTNFTDCPAVALLYAQGSRGVLLVVDIDDEETILPRRIFTASWPEREAQRFILWGGFDDCIAEVFPAKDLRTRLRREGRRNALHAAKARLLRAIVEDKLQQRALRSKLAARSAIADWSDSHEHARVISPER